jgi:hypothetical protein
MSSDKVILPNKISFDSSLEIFSIPASNLGITDMKVLPYKPTNALDSQSPIRFTIPNQGSSYIYLPDTRLQITAKIKQSDGSDLPEMPTASEDEELSDSEKKEANVASVGPTNAWIHALFDQIECSLNDCIISSGNTGYSFRALMNLLLNTSEAAKNSSLQAQMYYADTPKFANSLNVNQNGSNQGLVKRAALTAQSKSVTMIANLFTDLFAIQKYLLNGVTLSVTLFPTTDTFRLISGNDTPNYKVEITDATLFITHAVPASQVLLAHQELLRSGTMAKYFYVEQSLRKFVISKGNTSFFAENAFNGVCPDKIIMAFVSAEACGGSYATNPFNFKHYDINFVNISVEGVPAPRGACKVDFAKGEFGPYFEELFKGILPANGEESQFGNGITREAFANGSSLIITDLALQSKQGNFFPLKKESSVRMELSFAKPLPETIILLALIHTPNMFQIDFSRKVFLSP